jgi:hypothetical protein
MKNSLNCSYDIATRIRLLESDKDAVAELLGSVQTGRAKNDIDAATALVAATWAENELIDRGIPLLERPGAKIEYSMAGAESRSYGHSIASTSLLMARDELGWYLESVGRVKKFPKSPCTWAVKLTAVQAKICADIKAAAAVEKARVAAEAKAALVAAKAAAKATKAAEKLAA